MKMLPLLSLLIATTAAAAGQVIVNPNSKINAADVRDIYLGEMQSSAGVRLQPVDNGAAQTAFVAAVLNIDAGKYQSLWTKKSFRDGLTPPPTKGSDAEVIAFVKMTPGAIAYIDGAAPAGVTVLTSY